jgi:peptidoglycan L-alanyl-D-glutamate endopeptidase CwlK
LYNSKPKVTNAKAGQSPHNYNPSFAFDIGFIGTNKQMDWTPVLFERFANCVKSVSEVTDWGGNFKSLVDRPHFELKNWKTYLPKK